LATCGVLTTGRSCLYELTVLNHSREGKGIAFQSSKSSKGSEVFCLLVFLLSLFFINSMEV